MSEPVVEHDYQFHFKGGGDPLFVTVREGRDIKEDDPDRFGFICHVSPEMWQTLDVVKSELRGWVVTTRTFTEEPKA